jgi:2-iminobutanoate/2-iminopropanoate deaminase
MIKPIQTKNAPEAIGPYSQAIVADTFIFCSGQIGLHPQSGELVDDTIEGQTKQILLNLQAVLEEANSSLEHITQTTCYLKNMTEFHNFNAVYASFFPLHKPARVTVEVSNLPKNALIEITAIATRK